MDFCFGLVGLWVGGLVRWVHGLVCRLIGCYVGVWAVGWFGGCLVGMGWLLGK